MKKLILATAVVAASLLSLNSKAADNVVLVTLDGLRWQEVFSGADKNLIENTDSRLIDVGKQPVVFLIPRL